MKRRSFLAALAAFLLASVNALALRIKPPRYRFYWVDEDSEVFVARDLDTLNRYLGRTDAVRQRRREWYEERGVPFVSEDGEEPLSAENRGEAWDYADPQEMLQDEELGQELTFERAFEEWYRHREWFQQSQAAQIATSYN